MRPRYLLLAGDRSRGWPGLLDEVRQRTGLQLLFSSERLALFGTPGCRFIAVGERSVIVGTMFRKDGSARPLEVLHASEAAKIGASCGELLINGFWGGYVAALAREGGITVLRDPSGAMPCWFAHGNGHSAFSSDARLLVQAGAATAQIDWPNLARHFLSAGVPSPPSCITGISELLPGFSASVGNEAVGQAPCWSPWDHSLFDPAEPRVGAEELAHVVSNCVGAWAHGQGRLLLSVSGGLDSSIVAAVLAQKGADVICLTLHGEDPGSDERPFARALCSHLGLPLVEEPYRLEDIDIEIALAPHLPRPSDRTHALAYEKVHLRIARGIGAEAFVTGNGGDSVFGYSQSAAAIADRFLAEGLGAGLFSTVRDVCRQTGCSLADAVLSAGRIARGPRSYRCRPDASFIHPGLLASSEPAQNHWWLEAPATALPGKSAHVASILRVMHSLEPGRGAFLPVINSLLSQPIVEGCLKVPSWEWRSGGRDRSLARRAFAEWLPPLVAQRRVKGSPGHFAGQVLERFRQPIRERLLDGRLAAHGILDRGAIDEALAGERPCSDVQRVRILELAAAEAWLQSWTNE